MRAPVAELNVASPYGVFRPGQDAWHWGVDLAQGAGEPVSAPERMRVEVMRLGVSATATKLAPPLDGYGPGAVIARGDSGVWHLLAHLDPVWWATNAELPVVGRVYLEGEQVGVTPRAVGSAGPHLHWEVRTHRAVDSPATRAGNTMDPLAWLAGKRPSGGTSMTMLVVLVLLYALRR
jgi:murein DD-endopeptidase MepM/ murein hydrolase activator NlpD